MISLFNKMQCILMEVGKAFADGQLYMSSCWFGWFFSFCYRGSSLKIHKKTYLNNLHCLNSLRTMVKVKKDHSRSGNRKNMFQKKSFIKATLFEQQTVCVCMYLRVNVGSYLSVLCRWFPVLRCWIDSGIIHCLINSGPSPLKPVQKEPLVFYILASC